MDAPGTGPHGVYHSLGACPFPAVLIDSRASGGGVACSRYLILRTPFFSAIGKAGCRLRWPQALVGRKLSVRGSRGAVRMPTRGQHRDNDKLRCRLLAMLQGSEAPSGRHGEWLRERNVGSLVGVSFVACAPAPQVVLRPSATRCAIAQVSKLCRLMLAMLVHIFRCRQRCDWLGYILFATTASAYLRVSGIGRLCQLVVGCSARLTMAFGADLCRRRVHALARVSAGARGRLLSGPRSCLTR